MSMTSSCPACITPASCAARTPPPVSSPSTRKRRSRSPASWPYSPARISRASAPFPVARRCPACASRHTPSWRRIASTSSDIRSPSPSPPIATSPPTKWNTNPPKPSRTPKRRSRRALQPSIRNGPTIPLSLFTRKAASRKRLSPKRRWWSSSASPPEKAFAEAEVVVKQRITSQRLIPTAIETRGVVAEPHGAEKSLILYTSTQIPHLVRTLVAQMLGLSENRLRVITPEVGGGFGSKLNVYAEEALMGFVALRIGKPVKWIESRRENFQCTIHGRGHVDYYEIAAKRDGTVLGLRLKLIQDLGAYHQLLTPAIPTLSVLMMPGLYNFRNISAYTFGVFTNCVPTDAYRGAGRPEATHGIERMMDLLAVELKMDPSELRLINFIGNDEFPYATATGLSYDSGNYAEPLKKALDMVEYHKLRDQQTKAKAEGRLIGIGISTYGEICAFGPSPATPAGGWESATVKIEPSGKVTVMTGISPHGQGEETTFAQIAADELGVPLDDVMVLHGDTAIVQYGIGTFGSRGTAVGGPALYYALQDLKKKIVKFGELLLESSDVTFANGQCTSSRTGKSVGLAEVAGATYRAMKLPPDTEPGLVATRFWEPSNFAFPFGAHIVVTEVDRDTGQVQILRYVAVDDCGNIINPLLVDGQIHGGVVQGLGQALYEQAVYDDNGQLITGELMDYAVPKASMIPWIESAHTCTPSPVNPLGVKGVGEAGTIGASPAIVNSVVDALSHLGVRHIDMPLTPEKIWNLIQAGGQK